MSEPIKVGDLVVVVLPNGCRNCPDTSTGTVTTVREFRRYPGGSFCTRCDSSITDYLYEAAFCENGKQYGLHRLKRIPPLSELESEKRDERITA